MALVLLLLGTACASHLDSGFRADVPPASLLVPLSEPIQAEYVVDPGRGEAVGYREADLEVTRRAWKSTNRSGGYCAAGKEVVRIWNDRGERLRQPEVLQWVCKLVTVEDAAETFERLSLDRAAGFNYPNIDPSVRDLMPALEVVLTLYENEAVAIRDFGGKTCPKASTP